MTPSKDANQVDDATNRSAKNRHSVRAVAVRNRVVLVELTGASPDTLQALVAAGAMPELARRIALTPLESLDSPPGVSESAARLAMLTGRQPWAWGELDDFRFDTKKKTLVESIPDRAPWATRPGEVVSLDEDEERPPSWRKTPDSLAGLERHAAAAAAALELLARRIRDAVVQNDWRLLTVRIGSLRDVQCHAGGWLGVPHWPGGNPRWIDAARPWLRQLDACLGEAADAARRAGVGFVLVSPRGVVPSAGRITVTELLARRGLLRLASGTQAVGYRLARWSWSLRRMWPGGRRPVRAILPIDWRRSRAVAFHGMSAALVYLNRPERFGVGPIDTPSAVEATSSEAVAALREAVHPTTGEPLFVDVFETAERWGGDPLAHGWPEVFGVPAAGYQIRHRLDRKRRLLRPSGRQTGTPGGPGVWFAVMPERNESAGPPCRPDSPKTVADAAGWMREWLDM